MTSKHETICEAMLLFAVVSVLIAFSGCAGWTYNGIDIEKLREYDGKDTAMVVAGIATTYAVHTAGHFLAAKAMNKGIHIDGRHEIISDPMNDRESAWFGRSGAITQIWFGYIAKFADASGPFWDGYNAGTVIEMATYPIINQGYSDTKDISRDGNGDIEWSVYTALAIGLNFERGKNGWNK